MLRSIGNSPGNHWNQSWRRKGRLRWWEGFAEIESDDSEESMEPAGEVPLVGLGESELERLVRVDGEKPGVDSRDEGKHTGIRNIG